MRFFFEESETAQVQKTCVSFSPGSSCLAEGLWNSTIRMWNTRTWTRERECFIGYEDAVNCVIFSRDGKQKISSSDDGTLRQWDINPESVVE